MMWYLLHSYLTWLPTGEEVQQAELSPRTWCAEVSFWFGFNWNWRISYANDRSPCIVEILGFHSERTGSLCYRTKVNDAKVFVRILKHDSIPVNSVSEVKQRRPWKESEQDTYTFLYCWMKALWWYMLQSLNERRSYWSHWQLEMLWYITCYRHSMSSADIN